MDDKHTTAAGRKKLYEGYEKAVIGEIGRRRAEAFHVQDLRPWFEGMALKAIAVIDAEEAAALV